ncbi:hypothetical protein OGAPHI_006883 [Ogataea philodendri]|uniref:Uncharacterized protein n=1 Tax=Ogataea philodendri TaxID=1378263 RepID=A0A9P8NW54_9ASCO|nr:uncharacterized protein OGAPHI_006883 [Ogataea philodendri]KAH3660297.1 hypothetical protein OGAPHI_006883 [Ogataea philodendri]
MTLFGYYSYLVKQTETHVVVFLLFSSRGLFLLGSSLFGSTSSGTWGGTSSRSSTNAEVGQKSVQVLTSQSLSVDRSPDVVDLQIGTGGQFQEVFSTDLDVGVGQDDGSV